MRGCCARDCRVWHQSYAEVYRSYGNGAQSLLSQAVSVWAILTTDRITGLNSLQKSHFLNQAQSTWIRRSADSSQTQPLAQLLMCSYTSPSRGWTNPAACSHSSSRQRTKQLHKMIGWKKRLSSSREMGCYGGVIAGEKVEVALEESCLCSVINDGQLVESLAFWSLRACTHRGKAGEIRPDGMWIRHAADFKLVIPSKDILLEFVQYDVQGSSLRHRGEHS